MIGMLELSSRTSLVGFNVESESNVIARMPCPPRKPSTGTSLIWSHEMRRTHEKVNLRPSARFTPAATIRPLGLKRSIARLMANVLGET